jgi:hypothetical protein
LDAPWRFHIGWVCTRPIIGQPQIDCNSDSRKEVRDLKDPDRRPGYRLIFRPFITLKNGKRIYASQYGIKAFALWVKE